MEVAQPSDIFATYSLSLSKPAKVSESYDTADMFVPNMLIHSKLADNQGV